MKTKALLGLTLIVLFSMSTYLAQAQETEIQIAFSVNLLSPNTSAARNQWSLLMEQQLPKIGIGIYFHESTGWGNIGPRTWDYPLLDYDYIPTYAEGGYDLFFVGWSWGLDWDPTGLYDTASMIPNGDNHYQYSNPAYDTKLDQYLTELDDTTREGYAHELQAIMYEDLPAICIVYPRSLFGFKEGLVGIDGLLIASSNHRAENWDDPDDHIIKYGIPADLKEPNIFVVSSFYDMQWMQCVYGSLYKRAQDTHGYTEQIALNSTISDVIDDKINMTVYLDPDAKFSNGDIVLPSDVKYSYELSMTPAVGCQDYSYLTKWFADNNSISIIDDNDVPGGGLLFELKAVYNFARALLTFGIIDKELVSAAIASYGYDIFSEVPLTGDVDDTLVTSCGPFMLETFDPALSVMKMVPNVFYSEEVLLDELYLTYIAGKDSAVAELISGEIDIMDAQYYPVLADFEGVSGIEGILIKDPSHQEIGVNMRHPIMGTGELTPVGTADAAKGIRKAISHAIPRETIVSEILEGLGSPGVIPCPDAVVGFDDSLEFYSYDLDLAIDFVEAAGYTVEVPVPTETGIAGLVFLSFLGLAALIGFKKYKK